ncbi:MAG: tetratricopeptide repeat protein [Saprospiraceae bacterium]|nr:tetratricopeptide repeat protein [Saprospiraceae bacterium]
MARKKHTTQPAKSAAPTAQSTEPARTEDTSAPAPNPSFLGLNNWLLAGILVAATVAVYYSSLSNDFMIFDDDKAIRYNNVIKNPTLRGIFGGNNLGMYAPITWLGYALVYGLAGENATAFHTFNLILHAGSAVAAFALLNLLQRNREISFFAALLFALHPLTVEPTCWIAGQSTLTFSFFYLLSLIAYVQWQGNQKAAFYGLSLFLFLLSILAKSAAVTLPLVLLLFDWYRNGRLSWKNVLGKAPYFLASLAFGLYTFSTRAAEGHKLVVSSSAYNLLDRFFMVCHSLLFYPAKLLLPVQLSIFYPMEKQNGAWPIGYYLAPLAVAALVWLVWKYGRQTREIALGAGWYLLPLAVMLPYVSVGTFEMRSDRYVYISSIGFWFLAVWALQKLQAAPRRAILLVAAVVFGFLTHEHSKVWKNEVSVFQNCVDRYPDAALCNCNLAYGQLLNFDFENSIKHYNKTLELDKGYVEAYNGRGQAFLMTNKFKEAYADFDNAIKAGIVTPKLYLNRGKCLVILNKPAEAIPDLTESIRLEPRNPETYYFKAVAESKTGAEDEAIADYGKAIELNPKYVEALVNRGLIYAQRKNYEAAIADYTAALAADPKVVIALNNRAAAHMSLGQYDKSIEDLTRAIQLQPNYARAYDTRSRVYQLMGQPDKAAADAAKAKELMGGGK